ncbi:MAG: FAD binding domain-containing protein [Bacillota bacterium]
MGGFEFCSVDRLEEALSILTRPDSRACVVAGGTDVVRRIRNGEQAPGLLLDISRIHELRGIREESGLIRVGALTTIAELAASELLLHKAPALLQAANRFADPNTRNRATLGGNIANASPGGDTLPPLYALGAQVLICGPKGSRSLPINECITGSFKTALDPDELVMGVCFAPCPNSAFTKVALRRAMAISMETAAVALEKDDEGVVTACRVAFGALASTPVRGFYAEQAFIGKRPDQAVLAAAKEAAVGDIRPRDGLRGTREYRYSTVGVILERTFQAAYSQ